MHGVQLYVRYARASIRRQLAYRASFAMTLAGTTIATASEYVAIWALFDRFAQIRGWTLPEVAVFYGLASIIWAIAEAVGRGFDLFAGMVRAGDVDRLLLRPRSVVLQLLGHELTLRRIGRLAQGIVVVGYASHAGALVWTPAHAALFALAVICGCCAFLGLLVLEATSAFWTVEGLEAWNAFVYGGVTMSQYPLAIYRRWFRALFIYVFPIGCVIYFPGVALLDRPDPLGAPAFVGWLAPLAGPVALSGCLAVWRLGVRHYRSTGS